MNLLGMITAMEDAGVDPAQILSTVKRIVADQVGGQRERSRRYREKRQETQPSSQNGADVCERDVTLDHVANVDANGGLSKTKTSETPPSLKGGYPQANRRGTRLPSDWEVPADWVEEVQDLRSKHGLPIVDLELEALKFANYWHGKSGRDACKLDWRATWRKWALSANQRAGPNGAAEALRFDTF